MRPFSILESMPGDTPASAASSATVMSSLRRWILIWLPMAASRSRSPPRREWGILVERSAGIVVRHRRVLWRAVVEMTGFEAPCHRPQTVMSDQKVDGHTLGNGAEPGAGPVVGIEDHVAPAVDRTHEPVGLRWIVPDNVAVHESDVSGVARRVSREDGGAAARGMRKSLALGHILATLGAP